MLVSFLLITGLTSGFQAPTDEGGIMTLSRVRGVDASMRATIDQGCRRSPVFAELARAVERSNFVVYVEAVPTLRNGMTGALLHGTAGTQYLRIHVKLGLPLDRQVAVIAHELQHVREVVQAGISAHAAEMEMLFRRIGGKRLAGGRRQQFETAAALRVGDLVAADLRTQQGAGPSVGSCRVVTQ
jgi:hypothetical protein